MSKYWEIDEDEFEYEVVLDSDEEGPMQQYFQFERPVSDFKDFEWAELKRIAQDCFKAGLYDKNQFKIAIEAYHRWIALTELNKDLESEFSKKEGPKIYQ